MNLKATRRNSVLFILVLFCLVLVSNDPAYPRPVTSDSVDLSSTRNFRSDLYVLMSQKAKHAADIEIVMSKSMSSGSILVDPNKDWRDTDWKDPFGPKVDVSKRSDSQTFDSDVVITLEQQVSPTPLSSDSFNDLVDPFAPKNEAPEISDPFEGYNRFMFGFNEGVYENVLEPVAEGYRDFVNEDIRMLIKNIFSNALSPLKLVSSFLQGDLDKTGRVIGRTVINTTLGIGGMFDVADSLGIESVNEDIDQTLGVYGVPTGPYIMLPLLGPTTLRGLVGKAGGAFLSPTFHFAPGFEVGAGITMTDKINEASFILDDKKQLEESTVDEYESMKDFYNQYRFGLMNE